MAKISVVGTWHQASIVSACFADMGHQVFGVGDNPNEIELLNAAKPLVREPKLEAIMRRNLRAGRLRYTTDYCEALTRADFAYLSIDTPVGANDEADLTSIFDAARKIGQAMRVLSRSPDPDSEHVRFAQCKLREEEGEGAAEGPVLSAAEGSGDLILCISAQVPVGTCEQIAKMIAAENSRHRCDVAYVPEFLRLGTAVHNFRHPDRIVIGAKNRQVAEKIAKLYEPLARPIVKTDIHSAEMAKHASNAFLATSISFMNEIANLCDEAGADALEVAKIMRLDRRIGPYAFLSPGLGFAGGTLGREIRALQKLGQSHQRPTPLMDAVMQVNHERARLVGERLVRLFDTRRLDGLVVGVLGLTYKAGTSTLRRSISLEIIRDLIAKGAHVKAFDPLANLAEVEDLPPFERCSDPYMAAQDSDAIVLVTEWANFRELDLSRLRRAMKRPVFVDTRNLFDPDSMAEAGFIYSGIGRGMTPHSPSQL